MSLTSTLAKAFCLCCTCVTGCTRVGMAPPSAELRVVTGSARTSGEASTFHAEVQATRATDGGLPSSPLWARVTLELKGDALEYRMQLRNPGAELVTEALVTMQGDGGAPSSAVVHLFSDAGFRSSMLELRGMATVRASMRAATIAEELQGAPQRFTVVLKGSGPEDFWSGPLRIGR
ncbi:MAG: hypothetical protein H7066_10635 [Cytophagaceae bacterium]|nr:hypothetical protein [Gemmatimonadaceae bacterium]